VAKQPKKTRWHSCNVLQVDADGRKLWEFSAGKKGFALEKEESLPLNGPLPAKVVAKDWKGLFQPRLNIAWLPVEKVFLRVTHLPAGAFDETLSMVELQLEKLSPLPVTQIVWSIQVLPQSLDGLQTIIVIIVARDLVEEFLGRLEGQGYLADRLELPMLDQLQATPITGDGAWVYPTGAAGILTGLVAWWYGGVLRGLGLLHLPAGPTGGSVLKEQLAQMAWSGELEGWLTSPPRWHLVADEATAATWQPLFRDGLGQPVEIESPLPPAEMAVLTANRAARTNPGTGILPADYASRYHQQFVDRLWMRGLGAVLAVYVMGVMIYFVALTFQNMKADGLDRDAGGMSNAYTNTLKLKAQLQILQDRQALKYASLECWSATAETLPEGLTLQSMEFRNGKFTLNGSAPADQSGLILSFNDRLRKTNTKDGQPLFARMEPPITRQGPGGSLTWSFSGDLARSEETK
jgi:hypothetical protein